MVQTTFLGTLEAEKLPNKKCTFIPGTPCMTNLNPRWGYGWVLTTTTRTHYPHYGMHKQCDKVVSGSFV